MLSTLISLLGGGLLRALPEIVNFFHKKEDNAHELAMLDKQIQLEQLQAQAKQQQIAAQGLVDQNLEQIKTAHDALQAQFQMLGDKFQTIGNRWVDGINALTRSAVDVLNMLVRPATTYYFLAMFGAYKAALLKIALGNTDVWHAILQVYTPDDAAMLSGILSFWFVGRVFDKAKS